MGSLSLRMPDSYHSAVKAMAAKDSVSINQFIVSAVAEKLAALETSAYLAARASRASKEKFEKVLAKAPDADFPQRQKKRPGRTD